MKLPKSVQPIADVIGIEQTLRLIGQLPTCRVRDNRYPNAVSNRIILIVPRTLRADDKLVRMIGWHDAKKLVYHFAGEYLYPANCTEIYRDFLKQSARHMQCQGMKPTEIAEAMQIPYRTISRWLCNANPQHAEKLSAGNMSGATGGNVGKHNNVVN